MLVASGCDPEVSNLYAVVLVFEENIAGFQIPMNNLHPVQVLDTED